MPKVFFGVTERIHKATSVGPRARLKPLWETSSEKTHWHSPSEDFSNSGLVSWWQPPSDLALHSPWLFQIEESPTFDPDKPQHDFFRVRGNPTVPLELLEVGEIRDEEELREYITATGIPAESVVSKRVVFRLRSKSLVGPLELMLKNGRYYADEHQLDLPVMASRDRADLSLAEWSKHRFLPPEGWSIKTGELDFSPTEVFLKRVFRDLRKLTPSLADDVKLTDKLISRYCSAVESATLSQAQRYRLLRLRKLSERKQDDVTIPNEALTDFLSIGTVAELLDGIKKKAAEDSVASMEASLAKLRDQRSHLEEEVSKLSKEVNQRKKELALLESQHVSTLTEFENTAKQRFRALSSNASEFLAEIALVRAALGLPNKLHEGQATANVQIAEPGTSETLGIEEFPGRVRRAFAAKGLGCLKSASLLASLASGFVPIVRGPQGRECLTTIGHALAGDRVYWVAVNPSHTSPTQLGSELVNQDTKAFQEARTLGGTLQNALATGEISIIVLDGINLGQIDSALLPLIRRYVQLRCETDESSTPRSRISTAVGAWPANLLLAGLMIESPLSLPVSTELWSYASLVDVKDQVDIKRETGNAREVEFPSASQLSYGDWHKWLHEINNQAGAEPMVLAAYLGHQFEVNSLLRKLMRNLALGIEKLLPDASPVTKLNLFAEMTAIPYCLSRGWDPAGILAASPVAESIDAETVPRLSAAFKKWGVDVV